MKSSGILFRVERCTNPVGNDQFCKSETEINEFISDLNIQFWSIESALNLNKYGPESNTKSWTLQHQILLSSAREKIVPNYDIFLNKVNYDT